MEASCSICRIILSSFLSFLIFCRFLSHKPSLLDDEDDEWLFCANCKKFKQLLRVWNKITNTLTDALDRPIVHGQSTVTSDNFREPITSEESDASGTTVTNGDYPSTVSSEFIEDEAEKQVRMEDSDQSNIPSDGENDESGEPLPFLESIVYAKDKAIAKSTTTSSSTPSTATSAATKQPPAADKKLKKQDEPPPKKAEPIRPPRAGSDSDVEVSKEKKKSRSGQKEGKDGSDVDMPGLVDDSDSSGKSEGSNRGGKQDKTMKQKMGDKLPQLPSKATPAATTTAPPKPTPTAAPKPSPAAAASEKKPSKDKKKPQKNSDDDMPDLVSASDSDSDSDASSGQKKKNKAKLKREEEVKRQQAAAAALKKKQAEDAVKAKNQRELEEARKKVISCDDL